MKKSQNKTILVSGGFDPIHKGHISLIKEAKKLGNELVVVLNNDNWLNKKKGYVFMPEKERKIILEALADVDEVIISNHKQNPEDMSIIEELKQIKPDVFANGGDRKANNIPEYKLCEELEIEMVFNVGGEKKQSSSWLVEKVKNDK